MKHVEIVDRAPNRRREISAVSDEDFAQVFETRDEVCLEDLEKLLQDAAAFWDRYPPAEVDRRTVVRIHGVFHTHQRGKVSFHA